MGRYNKPFYCHTYKEPCLPPPPGWEAKSHSPLRGGGILKVKANMAGVGWRGICAKIELSGENPYLQRLLN